MNGWQLTWVGSDRVGFKLVGTDLQGFYRDLNFFKRFKSKLSCMNTYGFLIKNPINYRISEIQMIFQHKIKCWEYHTNKINCGQNFFLIVPNLKKIYFGVQNMFWLHNEFSNVYQTQFQKCIKHIFKHVSNTFSNVYQTRLQMCVKHIFKCVSICQCSGTLHIDRLLYRLSRYNKLISISCRLLRFGKIRFDGITINYQVGGVSRVDFKGNVFDIH